MPPDPEDDELAGWHAHAEPGQTVERGIDGIGRFARNSGDPGTEARRMANVGVLIIAVSIGFLLLILVVAVIREVS